MKQFTKSIRVVFSLTGFVLLCAYTTADISANASASIPSTQSERATSDTIRFSFPHSSFQAVDSILVEISAEDYLKFQKAARSKCKIDSSGFIDGYGISSKRRCDEICVDYLEEKSTGNQLILPCDYDGGIMGLYSSPRCKQFIVFSSYDGPGYDKYYQYRCEIYGFQFSDSTGLAAIEPSFTFKSGDWSIEDVTWISEKQIALKTYTENNFMGSNLQFKYYTLKLSVH